MANPTVPGHPLSLLDLTGNPATGTTKTVASLLNPLLVHDRPTAGGVHASGSYTAPGFGSPGTAATVAVRPVDDVAAAVLG